MPRSATHDRDVAINRALRLFWKQGYHGTSMKDIERALDMRPGSIYAAFGSKDGLFVSALDRYGTEMGREFAEVMGGAGSPVAGIRCYLRTVARACAASSADDDAEGAWPTPGCMLVKTLLELHDDDGQLHARAQRVLAEVEMILTARLTEAKARGELRSEAVPRRVARLVQAQIMGLRVFAEREVDARAVLALGDDMARILDPYLVATETAPKPE